MKTDVLNTDKKFSSNSFLSKEKKGKKEEEKEEEANDIIKYDINITGLPIVFDRETCFIRRSYWALILIVCTVLLLGQSLDRLWAYLDGDISVDVQVIDNTTLIFPAITVCVNAYYRYDEYDPRIVKSFYEKIYNDKEFPGFKKAIEHLSETMDVEELWDNLSWNVSEMIDKCFIGRGVLCEDHGTFETTKTILGKCLTFKGNPVSLAGSYHGLYIRLDYPSINESFLDKKQNYPTSWVISLQGAWENPSVHLKTHGYLIESTWNKDLSLFVKEFSNINKETKPCLESETYDYSHCTTDCFNEQISNFVKCKLPYMTSNLSMCKGVEEYKDTFYGQINFLMSNWTPSKCNCPMKCKYRSFQYQGDTTEDRTDTKGRVRVFFEDMNYEYIIENYSYSFPSLIADFGGMLGLLLGASILTLVEFFEYIIFSLLELKVKNKEQKKRSKIKTKKLNVHQSKIKA